MHTHTTNLQEIQALNTSFLAIRCSARFVHASSDPYNKPGVYYLRACFQSNSCLCSVGSQQLHEITFQVFRAVARMCSYHGTNRAYDIRPPTRLPLLPQSQSQAKQHSTTTGLSSSSCAKTFQHQWKMVGNTVYRRCCITRTAPHGLGSHV